MRFNLGKRMSRGLIDKTLNSCTRWAEHRIMMPEPFPGAINFDHFPWQREILNIDEGFVTVKKAAQIGFSVAGMVRCLYVISELRRDCLYVLPTAGLAGNFSKARLDTLVNGSPELHELFANDSVTLKKTRNNVNMHIVGSISERNLVSNPVSSAIIDEYDRCAKNTYNLVKQRLAGQNVKYLFALSTPTLPEIGIDEQYRLGTKEKFMFNCPSCGKFDHLDWFEEDGKTLRNIVIHGEHMNDPECHDSYYICSHCKTKLPHELKKDWLRGSKWEPTARVQGHRSFHINQMYAPNTTPGELVQEHHRSQLSDLAAIEFKNQKLGLAHVCAGAQLTDEVIKNCKQSYQVGADTPQDATEIITMGVDIGNFLDVVVNQYKYDRDPGPYPYECSKAKLLQTRRIPLSDETCWRQLDEMMATWQIRYAVLDFQPETFNAKAFCKRWDGFASVCQYRRGTSGKEIKETLDDDTLVKTLTVSRTVFMDLAMRRYHKNKIEIPGNISSVFVAHMMSPVRTYEEDELGLPRPVYVSRGDDHFAHASLYAEVAHFMAYKQSTGRSIKPGEAI